MAASLLTRVAVFLFGMTAIGAGIFPFHPSLAAPVGGAAAAVPTALAIHRGTDLRIMVLGDSITAGVISAGVASEVGGYRGRLAQLLQADGYHVTFVGSRADYETRVPTLRHDGWPGYVIRATSKGAPGQLLGTLVERELTKYDPDVILLMAGTNDLLRYEAEHDDYDQAEIVASMDLLLRQIFRLRPHVRVILAGIVNSPRLPECMIERFDTGRDSCAPGKEYANLHSLADQFIAQGYAIRYVDAMYGVLPRDATHFPDGIHPSPHGYDALASVWYNAIRSITQDATGTLSSR